MPVSQSISTHNNTGNNYHTEYSLTTLYAQKSFGFPAQTVSFVNDSNSDTVQISWDGATLAYTLKAAEYKDLPAYGRTSVYVKATAGGESLRITAV